VSQRNSQLAESPRDWKPLHRRLSQVWTFSDGGYWARNAAGSCDTYNRFLPFARARKSGNAVLAQAAAVARAVQAVEDTLRKAREDLDRKEEVLRDRINAFIGVSLRAPDIYQTQNLFGKSDYAGTACR